MPTVQQALLAQVGPDNNYMPPAYFSSLGNDDQAFWAFAAMSAAEYGFPIPSANSTSTWIDLVEAVFNTQWPRWNTASCGGGLKWQIFPSNKGYNYKNTISNGGLLQISARLARYTGNQTYVHWAEKAWDWMYAIGLIDDDYNVFDGTNDEINCTQIDHIPWTYNYGVLLYGTAIMYNYTNGSQLWEKRTTGILTAAANTFFSPYKNATDIMYQYACEPYNTCDNDQLSFKAYLARWMAKAAIVAPYITEPVTLLLTRSAEAAARSCSGPPNGTTCGEKWYVGGYDGSYGVGQELSALETVQSLLLLSGGVNGSHRYPYTQSDVHIAQEDINPSSTLALPAKTSGPTMGATPRSAGASRSCEISRNVVGVWASMVIVMVVGACGFIS